MVLLCHTNDWLDEPPDGRGLLRFRCAILRQELFPALKATRTRGTLK